jgi:Zn-dependent peptidase ImmA (M78 family)
MTLLTELRSIVPSRRLTFLEARMLAERQATHLLQHAEITDPCVPSSVVTELPFLTVGTRPLLRSSGATQWVKPRWVMVLNSLEPHTRQRFSLGHELKHVLDHGRVDVLYGTSDDRSAAVEHLCDYFSACLFMPRTWLKNAYASGIQNVFDLAELFDVSAQAMQVRLLQLGIVNAYERHGDMNKPYLRSRPVLLPELAA